MYMSNNSVSKLIDHLKTDFNTISESRKVDLNKLGSYIEKKINSDGRCALVAICTHNSRRSQIVEFWMNLGSSMYLNNTLSAYSGGTEVTALNHRVANGFYSLGFEIEKIENDENPIHFIEWNTKEESIGPLYSKLYNDSYNPTKSFATLMVCDHANEVCPIINGAEDRFPLLYTDPKTFDNTEKEAEAYKDKIIEIGKEILYCFSNITVKESVTNNRKRIKR